MTLCYETIVYSYKLTISGATSCQSALLPVYTNDVVMFNFKAALELFYL